jgi:hypothetical protein
VFSFHGTSLPQGPCLEGGAQIFQFALNLRDFAFVIAKVKRAVSVAGKGEHLWIERGEIAFGIDAERVLF